MVDKDGAFTYSPVFQIFIKGGTQTKWYVQSGYINLQLGYTPSANARVGVYTLDGSKVTEQKMTDREARIFMGNRPKGIYMVSVLEQDVNYNFKVLF
jgi:hypothetical protein